MGWSKLIDMELDDDEKIDAGYAPGPDREPTGPDYPYGLRITLTAKELEKLGLEADCDIGDVIDIRAFASVISVHKEGDDSCVCLQIEKMAVENEMTEEMEDEDDSEY